MIPYAVPAADWSDVTYSPAPTRQVEKVYRRLGVKTSRDPDVVVQSSRIPLPDGLSAKPPLRVVVITYTWVDKKTGEGLVVVGPKATRWQIAAALFAAGIR